MIWGTILFSFLILCIQRCESRGKVIDTLSKLEFDENDHLKYNYMLLEKTCSQEIEIWKRNFDPIIRKLILMQRSVANLFNYSRKSKCTAVCLNIGTKKDLLQFPVSDLIYSRGHSRLEEWMGECEGVEFGIVSPNIQKGADLFAVDDRGRRRHMFSFMYGVDNTPWAEVPIGRKYEIVDSDTSEVLSNITVTSSGVAVLNREDFWNDSDSNNLRQNPNSTFEKSWNTSQNIRRTFSRRGFEKSRLPKDLWNLISTYHYNNRDKFVQEEPNFVINWQSAPSYVLSMPPNLLHYLQGRLKRLVEEWIGGVELDDQGVIYGVRKYTKGTRLLTHVDIKTTHAVAMIINVDQSSYMPAPWKLEIYDFDNRLHEIEMQPGDVVFYEVSSEL